MTALFKFALIFFILLQTAVGTAAPRYDPEAARFYDSGLRALAHGKTAIAQTELEKAIALDPTLADAHCVLGLLYKSTENIHAAADAFQRAITADENYIEADYELGDILLFHLGDTARAIHTLRKVIVVDTDHARARTLLGIAYLRDNQPEAAISHLQRAISLNPTAAQARYTLGNVHLQQENWQSAISVLKALIERDPFHAQAHFSLGTAYRRINEIETAQYHLQRFEGLSIETEHLTSLKRYVQQNPTESEPWYKLGRIQLRRRLWKEGIHSLERYVNLAPHDTRGYEALGYAHFQQHNYPQAIAIYQKVVQQKPNVATYHNSLAGAYLMAEQYPEAIAQYQIAIRLEPTEPRFYRNLAAAYERSGAHTEAERTYEEYERLTAPTAPTAPTEKK